MSTTDAPYISVGSGYTSTSLIVHESVSDILIHKYPENVYEDLEDISPFKFKTLMGNDWITMKDEQQALWDLEIPYSFKLCNTDTDDYELIHVRYKDGKRVVVEAAKDDEHILLAVIINLLDEGKHQTLLKKAINQQNRLNQPEFTLEDIDRSKACAVRHLISNA